MPRRSCCSPTRSLRSFRRTLRQKERLLRSKRRSSARGRFAASEIVIHYQSPHEADQQSLAASLGVVQAVGRISELRVVAAGEQLPPSASASIDQRTISSPLDGLIDDPAAELARLQKRKAKAHQDLDREQKKLSNSKFIEGAPAEIVAEVHTRIADFKRLVAQVEQQEQAVSALAGRR